jgi:hypothetical protein
MSSAVRVLSMINFKSDLKVPPSDFAAVSDSVDAILKLDVHVHVYPITLFSNSYFQLTDERKLGKVWFVGNFKHQSCRFLIGILLSLSLQVDY